MIPEENLFLEKIRSLQKQGDWKSILSLNNEGSLDDFKKRKLLWAWPTEGSLAFVCAFFSNYRVTGVMSVGCGCGLLEWIIQEYSGLEVIGIEVNKEWWESKYAVTPFIPLTYVNEDFQCPQGFALMFCYFNNGPAFRDYIKRFRGVMVVIIGPARGAGRHTDPQPFDPDFGQSQWQLEAFQEIRQTKDFIAIYLKRH
ncbi:uncharacterized protein [Euwallacea fornicatus]|uniref:uncharacterized protein n=1 Tax=Euwallacea fornicatus TaxID=995702 RepID=UPI00338E8EC0